MRFINALESPLGKEVEKVYMDMQPGDVLRLMLMYLSLKGALTLSHLRVLRMDLLSSLNGMKIIIK